MTCACLHVADGDPLARVYGLGVPAARYQSGGYCVLPLARGGKKPHRMLPYSGQGRDGVHHASGETGQAGRWWAQDPAANVGVATGALSRLAVIDLDVKGGHDGPGEFSRFLSTQAPGHMTGVPYARTPSGGVHIWLRTPAGVAVPDRPGILPGVDVKGDGGLVVAPPSMLLAGGIDRPGERGEGEAPVPYTWAAGCPCTVPDAPAWVLPWLQSAPASGSPPGAGRGESGEGPDLASLKRTGIPRGERNATLHRLACSLYRRHGTGPEGSVTVREELNAVWRAGDRSGMTAHELLTIADSARRFVAAREKEDAVNLQKLAEWMES